MQRINLKNARKAKGKTQVELATMAGVSRSLYSLIEAGLRNPTYGLAVRLADCLSVPVERIFFDLEGFRLKRNKPGGPT